MPELPEVETVKRSLEPLLCQKKINKVIISKEIVIAHPDADEFCRCLKGKSFEALLRRGKYLQFVLNSKDTLIAHLRMTGRFVLAPAYEIIPKHTHAIFTLEDGNELRFTDVRRFGRLWLIKEGEKDSFSGLNNLGPEPFSPSFNSQYLYHKLNKRKVSIKQALLDQAVVAGLGNIYVDESLFAAGIAPWRKTGEITKEEWERLAKIIPEILADSIKNRGTSFRDYRDGLGQKGDNLVRLKVYQRKGKPCPRCGEEIQKTVIAQRSTFYCPLCQK